MSELKPCEAIEILESIYPSKKQIVTGEYPEVAEALDMAIAALRRAQPANESLTLEQLRGIENPVWCACDTFDGKNGYWCLCQNGIITPPSCMTFNAVERPDWIFYRRKPEGSENDG